MFRIGIDLGGTKISAAVIDDDFNILAKSSCKTNAQRESDLLTKDIADLCRSVADKIGLTLSDVESIGIGCPGAIDNIKGTVEYSCNLPYVSYPLRQKLSQMSGVDKIYIDNDANAAALGEAVAGAAKGTASSVMITLGTGVGGGIIINNKIVSGINGAGGELGHMVIKFDGRPCPCTRRGCFEAYSSATALKNITKERLRKLKSENIPTLMLEMCGGDPEKASPRTAFEASKKNDTEAKKIIEEYTQNLACGITNIINIFQPETVIIGGGLSGEGDYLLKPLLPIIEREQYTRTYKNKTTIKIATLGNDAGLIGAAALGI